MKARVLTTQKDIREAVEDNIKSRMPEIAKEHSVQLMAVVLTTLNKDYRHTPTYCRAFFHKINEMFSVMDINILGKKFDVEDCIDYCKNKLGIDLEQEITAKVECK